MKHNIPKNKIPRKFKPNHEAQWRVNQLLREIEREEEVKRQLDRLHGNPVHAHDSDEYDWR